MSKGEKDRIAERIKRINDVLHESTLCATILSYARSGHASPLMIEQAIVLLDKHILWARSENDNGSFKSAEALKDALNQALIDGIETLRAKRPATRETVEIEIPLANQRISAGHRVRRQLRCANGIIDIYDLTKDELIECKIAGSSAALGEAASQLQRYRKGFPGASLAIAVIAVDLEATWLADLLREQGIAIIEMGRA